MSEPSGKEGEQQRQTAGAGSQSIPPPVPLDATALLRFIEEQEVKASAKADQAAREADKRQIETLTAISKQSKLGLWIAAIVACCTIGQWITTILNNNGTTEQTKQIISAAKINACASQKSAQAARDFADTSSDIHDSLGDAVGKLDAQVRATEESAKLTRHVIEGGEAAVISPYGGPLNIPNLMSLLYGIIINFTNNGKVNAVHFASHASLQRETLPDYSPIGKPLYSDLRRDQIIPTSQRQEMGADQVVVSTFDTSIFTDNDILQMKTMRETFKIEGVFSYGNGFGEKIKGKFCLLYLSMHNPDGSGSEGWISCEEGRSDMSATLRRQKAAQQGYREPYPIIPSASTITLPAPT